MSSTLIELPPELADSDDVPQAGYVEAGSVEEFAHQTQISDQEVLERVLMPGRTFGPYRILGFVASGGMGEIYAARRRSTDGTKRQPVALKVISSEHSHDWRIAERFKREASISESIRSPNVIQVYEYGETDDNHTFLAMELLSGEELFERLCRVRTLGLDALAECALQVLSGLSDIHDAGFIHRDIKPENVFLTTDARGREVVKILDFGIAKRRDERSDPLLSVAGQVYGTPEYLAPEQAVDPDVDPRADLYSVGVLLYEAATGSLPFQGDTSYSVIAAHQNEPVPALPSSVDAGFAEIVYTAMAKDRAERFQSADEMARVLGRWLDQTSWVDELPGASNGPPNDLLDSQELTPSRPNTAGRTSPTQVSSRAATTGQHQSRRSARPVTELFDPGASKSGPSRTENGPSRKTLPRRDSARDSTRPNRPNKPATNKPDTNKPDTNKPDTNKPDTNKPDKTPSSKDSTPKAASKPASVDPADTLGASFALDQESADATFEKRQPAPNDSPSNPGDRPAADADGPGEVRRAIERQRHRQKASRLVAASPAGDADQVPAPSAPDRASADDDHQTPGNGVATLVTWIAVVILAAAIGWAVYSTTSTPSAAADSAGADSAAAGRPDQGSAEGR